MDVSFGNLDLAALGIAYVYFLAGTILCIVLFALSRRLLVITPNLHAKHYGLYVVAVFVTIAIAATMENELAPDYAGTLPYALFPQLLMLAIVHLWLHYEQEPWLIGLGVASLAASLVTLGIGAAATGAFRLSHGIVLGVLLVLIGYVWHGSISTKHGFIKSHSIHVESKETMILRMSPQKPWLGLPQWVALSCASLLLAAFNSMLQGSGLGEIPAVGVAVQSLLILSITAFVCAIPASTYWLAHRQWMPELTRFVWLVWIVVGFAFTYRSFLTSLERA